MYIQVMFYYFTVACSHVDYKYNRKLQSLEKSQHRENILFKVCKYFWTFWTDGLSSSGVACRQSELPGWPKNAFLNRFIWGFYCWEHQANIQTAHFKFQTILTRIDRIMTSWKSAWNENKMWRWQGHVKNTITMNFMKHWLIVKHKTLWQRHRD